MASCGPTKVRIVNRGEPVGSKRFDFRLDNLSKINLNCNFTDNVLITEIRQVSSEKINHNALQRNRNKKSRSN